MTDRVTSIAEPVLSIRFIMTGLLLVILLGAIEQTIVVVALPAIASDLQGFDKIAWVVSAYLIASTVSTPIYGKLSDMYGRRTMLTAAIAIFLCASLGCAFAQTMPQLIIARVIQGLGGGGLISVAQATIADAVAPRERGRYQVYISAVWLLASMSGPIVGGYLTDYLSWHWIFWINFPVGIIALFVMRRSLRALPFSPVSRRVDYLGALLFASGITIFLIAITRIGEGARLNDWLIVSLLSGSVLIIFIFLWRGLREPDSIIPLRMLSNRTVAICCIGQLLAYFQMISVTVLLPLWLQMVTGATAQSSGLRLLPLTLAVPVGAYLGGRLMSLSGRYKPALVCGSLLVTISMAVLSFCNPDHVISVSVVVVILGFGIGLQFPTSMVATQNAVIRSEIGVATALASFSRMLGGSIGVAVLTSFLFAFLVNGAPDLNSSELLNEIRSESFNKGELSDFTSGGGLMIVTRAFQYVFLISAAISSIAPFLFWKLEENHLRNSL